MRTSPSLASALAPLLALLVLAGPSSAETRVAIEVFFGAVTNLPTSLTIRQDGEPDLELVAHYRTPAACAASRMEVALVSRIPIPQCPRG